MDNENKGPQINILWLPTILGFGILYIISRIDFMPDVIPRLGRLDDVAVMLGLVWFLGAWLPKNRHRLYWFKKSSTQTGPGAGVNEQTTACEEFDFDPFKVLNLVRGASQEEVRHAYREMMSKYHPDKVSHLGEEFQRLAHGKVLQISKAYEMLCGKE